MIERSFSLTFGYPLEHFSHALFLTNPRFPSDRCRNARNIRNEDFLVATSRRNFLVERSFPEFRLEKAEKLQKRKAIAHAAPDIEGSSFCLLDALGRG